MSLNNFIPTLWSARLYETLKNAHVFANVVNRDYEGEISSYGDSVKINSIGSISVGDYAKNGTISLQQLNSAQTILEINQAKYFNFMVDDIDKAQSNPKVMDGAMQEAGYALADTADSYLAQFQSDASNTVTDITIDTNPENTYDVLADAALALDEANVPREGRFAVVPPFFVKGMVLAGIMETAGAISAEQEKQNGYVSRLLGFDIWTSNNLEVVGSDTVGIAGTRRAISFAEQVLDMEAYRPENRFADAVKGLHVYGGKVVYPDALVRLVLRNA